MFMVLKEFKELLRLLSRTVVMGTSRDVQLTQIDSLCKLNSLHNYPLFTYM